MNSKSKWFRRSIWAVVLLAVMGVGLGIASRVLLRRTPDWYQPDTSTDTQKHDAAAVIVGLIERVYSWGGKNHAQQLAAKSNAAHASATLKSEQQARDLLAEKPDEAFKINFTDDQLNAFFNLWENTHNRRQWFERYVDDPRLVLRENQLILVGKAKQMDLIVSLVFEPKLDGDGKLNMNLAHVLGGILPIPDAMWSGQRRSIEHTLEEKLPIYQQGAAITSDGIANGDAASAAMNELLMATLQYKPADPVIFIPVELTHLSQSLPVKITSLSIHDHTLDMSVEQMNADEREALRQQLLTNSVPAASVADQN